MANTKITADVIEANAVLAVSIADENITSAKLADLAVTEGKIANSAITAGKIATDAVITAKIQNGAITSAKLDTNIAVAGTLGVTGDITGTLATAAQPNITSLGSLTALDVTGSVTANSLITDDDVAGLTTLGRYSSGFAFSLLRPSSSALGIEIRTNAGNSLAHFLNDGTTKLHHNGSSKLTTTATGIEVTGTVTAADSLNVTNAGKIGFNTESEYTLNSIPSPDFGFGYTVSTNPMSLSGYYGLAFATARTERLRIDSSGGLITKPAAGGHAVFNEDGIDADFRVESDTMTHALFVQGNDGKVGVFNSAPRSTLEVGSTSAKHGIQLNGGPNGVATQIHMIDGKSGSYTTLTINIQLGGAGGYMYQVQVAGTSGCHFQTGGGYTNGTNNFSHSIATGAGFSVTSPSHDLIRLVAQSGVGTHPVCEIRMTQALNANHDQDNVTITWS